MGVSKETYVFFGIRVPYSDTEEYLLSKLNDKKEDEGCIYNLENILEESGIEKSYNFIEGPTDGEEDIYIGLRYNIDVGENFSINEKRIKADYDKIFTLEVKNKLEFLFNNRKEQLLVRVFYQ